MWYLPGAKMIHSIIDDIIIITSGSVVVFCDNNEVFIDFNDNSADLVENISRLMIIKKDLWCLWRCIRPEWWECFTSLIVALEIMVTTLMEKDDGKVCNEAFV